MLGERIAKARKKAGYNDQQSLAKEIKVGARTLADYETNKSEPKASTLNLIAEKCNISIEWLLLGRGTMHSSHEPWKAICIDKNTIDPSVQIHGRGTRMVDIPYYGDAYASAGGGADNNKISSDSVMSFDIDFLRLQLGIRSFSGIHIITAVGDSMQNTFQSGEILFILPFESEGNILRDNGIYVIHTPNGTIVKRIGVHPLKKSYILRSDNDDIPPIELEGDEVDACTIVGRVVAHFDRV